MAKKVRKDVKGRVLRNGETYIKDRKLYCFSYTDAFGKRGCFYSKDLAMLREKEAKYERDKLDGMDVYALSKSTLNYVFDRYIETKKGTEKHHIYKLCIYVQSFCSRWLW